MVAQRIAGLEEDGAVKRCLQALFTHELENADRLMPQYKEEYQRVIERCALDWDDETFDSGDTK